VTIWFSYELPSRHALSDSRKSTFILWPTQRPRREQSIAADRGGIIRFWNPGAERIFGHIRGDAIGLSLDLIIPERLRQRHWDGYRRTMESGKSRYGEGDTLSVPALHKNGRTISVEFIIIPLRDESGGMIGMAAIRPNHVRFWG
jgi:PAS domain S-box-containing protein